MDLVTFALAKSYTKKSLEGMGALQGKNCTVQSVTPIAGGQRVTLAYTLDDGTAKTQSFDVMDGAKGERGEKGEKGDAGTTGATGADGFSPLVKVSAVTGGTQIVATDKDGTTSQTVLNGTDGQNATFAVGTVESGDSPSVENVGTSRNAVLNFVLPKGEKGEKGEDGNDGQDGKSFDIKGAYATYDDLVAEHPTGSAGEAYFVGTGSNPTLYIWLTETAEWFNQGQIQGVKGDKGDTGEEGYSPTIRLSYNYDDETDPSHEKPLGVRITVQNKDSTSTADVANGAKGDTGRGVSSVALSSQLDGTHLLVYFDDAPSIAVDAGVISLPADRVLSKLSDNPIANKPVATKIESLEKSDTSLSAQLEAAHKVAVTLYDRQASLPQVVDFEAGAVVGIGESAYCLDSKKWYRCTAINTTTLAITWEEFDGLGSKLVAGNGISIDESTGAISSDVVEFHGTHDEWDSLSASEQAKYNARDFTDDVDDDDTLQAEIEELQGDVATNTTDIKALKTRTQAVCTSVRIKANGLTARKSGKVVTVNGATQFSADLTRDSWVEIATLPSGYRPSNYEYGTAVVDSGEGSVTCPIDVAVSGSMRIFVYANSIPTTLDLNDHYVFISLCFTQN